MNEVIMSVGFADDYIKNCEHLRHLLRGVESLAQRSHTKIEGLQETCAELDRPLQIVLCGMNDINYSAIIFHLFNVRASFEPQGWNGADFSSRFNQTQWGFPVQNCQGERDDLICIKSEDCQYFGNEDLELLQALGQESDCILWFFSAENPWSAKNWNQLKKLPPDLIDRLVIILETEGLETEQVQAYLKHMAALSENMQATAPIYPLNFKQAQSNDLAQIETKVNGLLQGSRLRGIRLTQVKEKLHAAIDVLQHKFYDRKINQHQDQEFLDSIRQEITRHKEREIQLYTGAGSNLLKPFVSDVQELLNEIYIQCGLKATLLDFFQRETIGQRLEFWFVEKVSTDCLQRCHQDCMEIIMKSHENWRDTKKHLEERISTQVDELDTKHFKHLILEIEESQKKVMIMNLQLMQVRTLINENTLTRRKKLKKYFHWSLLGFIATGVIGFFNPTSNLFPPFLFLAASLALLGYFLMQIYFSRRENLDQLEMHLLELQGDFRKVLVEVYQEMINRLFTGYTPLFLGVQKKIADSKNELAPLEEECNQLYQDIYALNRYF